MVYFSSDHHSYVVHRPCSLNVILEQIILALASNLVQALSFLHGIVELGQHFWHNVPGHTSTHQIAWKQKRLQFLENFTLSSIMDCNPSDLQEELFGGCRDRPIDTVFRSAVLP